MRVVLTNISPVSNPNIIFIDEGFGCLDKENFIQVASILRKLKNNFSAMIVVTHIPELKSYADKTITISNANRDSIMRYGVSDAEIKISIPDTPIQSFIEIIGSMYRCIACGFVRKYTDNAVQKHLNAKSYKSKHEKYLSLLNKI